MTDPITPEQLDELRSRHSRKFLNGMVIVEVTETELHAVIDELQELRKIHRTRTEDAVERLHRLADLYDPDEIERLTVERDFALNERDAALAELRAIKERDAARD